MGNRGFYAEAGLGGGPAMLGMSVAAGSQAAGIALPPTTNAANDREHVPWHPDSGMFWLILFTLAAVFGIAGASAKVRVGRGEASASVGET